MNFRLKKAISLILAFVMTFALLVPMQLFAASGDPENTPTADFTMEIVGDTGVDETTVYKLVGNVTAENGIKMLEFWLAYDNTVIQPVVGEINTIDVVNNSEYQNYCFWPHLKQGTIGSAAVPAVQWYEGETKTILMYMVNFGGSATNAKENEKFVEFYFRLKDGRTLADLNSSTFALENQDAEDAATTILTGNDHTYFSYNEGSLTSNDWFPTLTYHNSNVDPIVESYPAGTPLSANSSIVFTSGTPNTTYNTNGIYWENNTLILSGVDVTFNANGAHGFNVPAGTTVMLKGSNTIKAGNGNTPLNAFYSDGNITISEYADGVGGDLTINAARMENAMSADGTITIDADITIGGSPSPSMAAFNKEPRGNGTITLANAMRLFNGSETFAIETYEYRADWVLTSATGVGIHFYDADGNLLASKFFNSGETVEYPGGSLDKIDGDNEYKFLYWSLSQDGGAVDITTLAADTSVYAVYNTTPRVMVAKIEETGIKYATVKEAVAAVPDGVHTTITLIADSEETEIYIPATKIITLDLDEYTLSHVPIKGPTLSYWVTTITNVGVLTIRGGTNGKIIGPMIEEHDEIPELCDHTDDMWVCAGSTSIAVLSDGLFGTDTSLTIESGTFIGKHTEYDKMYCVDGDFRSYGVVAYYGGTLSISGGTFEGSQNGVSYSFGLHVIGDVVVESISGGNFSGTHGAFISDSTVLEISGGSFTGSKRGMEISSYNSKYYVETISGGYFEGGDNGLSLHGIKVNEISGGEYEGKWAVCVYDGTSIDEISGGTFEGTSLGLDVNGGTVSNISGGDFFGYWGGIGCYNYSEVTINGGSFTGTGTVSEGNAFENGATLTINGGYFKNASTGWLYWNNGFLTVDGGFKGPLQSGPYAGYFYVNPTQNYGLKFVPKIVGGTDFNKGDTITVTVYASATKAFFAGGIQFEFDYSENLKLETITSELAGNNSSDKDTGRYIWNTSGTNGVNISTNEVLIATATFTVLSTDGGSGAIGIGNSFLAVFTQPDMFLVGVDLSQKATASLHNIQVKFTIGTGVTGTDATFYAKYGEPWLYTGDNYETLATEPVISEGTASSGGVYVLPAEPWSDGSNNYTFANIMEMTFTSNEEFTATAIQAWNVNFVIDGGDTGKGTLQTGGTSFVIHDGKTLADSGYTVPTVTATPGYVFTGWNGDTTAAITDDTTFAAMFENGKFAVTFPIVAGITITEKTNIDGDGKAAFDTNVTFELTFDPTKRDVTAVKYTIGNGTAVKITPDNGVYTIPGSAITDAVSVTIEAENVYAVTFDSTDSNKGTITAGNVQNVVNGQKLTTEQIAAVETTPAKGYKFVKWQIDSTDVTLAEYTVSGDVTIKAVFEPDTFNVTFPAEDTNTDTTATYLGNGVTFTPNVPGKVVYSVKYKVGDGADVSLTASANGSYTIAGSVINDNVTITYEMVTATITATTAPVEDEDYKVLLSGTQLLVIKMDALNGQKVTFDGTDMYWTDVYGGYVTIIPTSISDNAVISAKVNVVSGNAPVIAYDGDVLKDGILDVRDALIINNMMHNIAPSASVYSRLAADVDEDKMVTTADIMKVLNIVLNAN